MLLSRVALAVAAVGVAVYYLFSNYWYFLPGFLSYFTLVVYPHRPSNWEAQLQAGVPPARRIEGKAGEQPNVIFIVADDLGYNDISYYGGGLPGVETKHIDSIGREGVGFTNGYAGHATCAPSRASIMTGRYATKFGFEFTPVPLVMSQVLGAPDPASLHSNKYFKEREQDVPDMAAMTFPRTERTIAEHMHDADYHTMLVGKWHLGHSPGHRPEERGFDEMLGFNLGASLYLPTWHKDAVGARLDDFADKFLWGNLRYFVCESNATDSGNFVPDDYITDYLGTQAAHAVKANAHRPFFMYLAFNAPHTPLQALRADYDSLSHIEDHVHRVYAAMVLALDRAVGRVLAAVREAGLEDNTLIVFTSDNGGANYVNIKDINKPYRGWKATMFEGGLKVPFLMKWPARLPAGGTYAHPVGHIDMFATAAVAGGHSISRGGARAIDGVDLIPFVLKNESDSQTEGRESLPHETLFWRSGHYKALHYRNEWKLQVSELPPKVWLFDMQSDPTERHNLAYDDEYKEVLQMLLEVMQQENAQQSQPLWPALSATHIPVDKTGGQKQEPGDEYVLWEN